ncbi:hypothetical protein KC217_19610, partial [Mycobacterium tuberculosis]|nr:hypothetical protein [Mycobacterium tuberculosis]
MSDPSPPFKTRLALYLVDDATVALKAALLPIVRDVIPAAVAKSQAHAPRIVTAFKETYAAHGESVAKIDREETIKLFANPFADRWEAACRARAKA